jgi:hypothetical protein
MTVTEDILFAAVAALATTLSLPVKYPNTNGPEDAPTWLDVVHIPNGVAKRGWDDLKANHGLLNIGVNVAPNTGSTVAGPIIDAVLAAFPQGLVLRDAGMRVEFYDPPATGSLIESGQKAFYPVFMRYRTFED